MKRLITMLALVAVTGATGCMSHVKKPEVRMAGVRLGGIGLTGGLVYVRLNVTNPNRFGMETRAIRYDLDIADQSDDDEKWIDFADGVYAEPLKVGGRDSTMVEIPVEFKYNALGGAMRSILDRGTFNYRVSGEVDVREPIGTTVPFKKRGIVTLSSGG